MFNQRSVFNFLPLKLASPFRLERVLGGILFTLLVSISSAAAAIPVCLDGVHALRVNNSKVLHWKKATHNQFKARALVQGKAVRVTEDRDSHYQFEIKIGAGPLDVLEVVYNKNFGPIPNIKPGMDVIACGDYITATERVGAYEASPAGAIIHWVHLNPKGVGHESGFLVIEGAIVGNQLPLNQRRR